MVIPDFEKEIPKGSTLILTAPVTNPEKELYKVAVKVISDIKIQNVAWICYHKTPKDIIEHVNNSGATAEFVNKIQYIDMLSHMLGFEQKHQYTSYCTSPTDYNCLLRSIEQLCIKNDKNLIVFDNMNALMSYDMIDRMIRFIRNLNNLVSNNNWSIIYLGISGGSSPDTEISIHAAMDNIYYLQENVIHHRPLASWENFKDTRWTDVFSLNAPVVFFLLVVMMVSNIVLLIALFYLYIIK